MAQIHNSDIQKRIMEEAKLQLSIDKVPTQLAAKVVPVLVSNPKGKKKILVFRDANSGIIEQGKLSVPAGKKWKLLGAALEVVTDATVTDREVTLSIYIKGVLAGFFAGGQTQAASLTYFYTFNPQTSFSSSASGLYHTMPLPSNHLTEGDDIYFNITNKQAGDNCELSLIIEEEELLIDEVEHTAY